MCRKDFLFLLFMVNLFEPFISARVSLTVCSRLYCSLAHTHISRHIPHSLRRNKRRLPQSQLFLGEFEPIPCRPIPSSKVIFVKHKPGKAGRRSMRNEKGEKEEVNNWRDYMLYISNSEERIEYV